MTTMDAICLAIITIPVLLAVIGAIVVLLRRQSLQHRGTSPEEQLQMQGLVETARRMEQRIGYLENVLDTEAPGWRRRSEAR